MTSCEGRPLPSCLVLLRQKHLCSTDLLILDASVISQFNSQHTNCSSLANSVYGLENLTENTLIKILLLPKRYIKQVMGEMSLSHQI